jgi:ABC-type multidrug transport system ATPase subunit
LAEEICDRVYFLKDGTAKEVEEVENLKSKFLDQE